MEQLFCMELYILQINHYLITRGCPGHRYNNTVIISMVLDNRKCSNKCPEYILIALADAR